MRDSVFARGGLSELCYNEPECQRLVKARGGPQGGVIVSKLTSIALQKGDRHRFNLFLDGEFFAGVSESVLVRLGLYKGMELTEDLKAKILDQEKDAQLKSTALRYLEHRLRTEKEVTDRLKEESEEEERIQRIVHQLKAMGYINDLTYAKSYVRSQMRLQKSGPRVIAQQLKRLGVSEEYIVEAKTDYPIEEQEANARMLAEKLARSKRKDSNRHIVQKIKEHLVKKGFSSSVIEKILGNLDLASLAVDESERLAQAGEKAWRSYHHRFSDSSLRRKIYQNLMRKGFSSEAIQDWLDQYLPEGETE